MGDLENLRPVRIASDEHIPSNTYAFSTAGGLNVELKTGGVRKFGKFHEGVVSYSVERDGIVYTLEGRGLSAKDIQDVRRALATQKDIPAVVRRDFQDMLAAAKVGPEPSHKLRVMK